MPLPFFISSMDAGAWVAFVFVVFSVGLIGLLYLASREYRSLMVIKKGPGGGKRTSLFNTTDILEEVYFAGNIDGEKGAIDWKPNRPGYKQAA